MKMNIENGLPKREKKRLEHDDGTCFLTVYRRTGALISPDGRVIKHYDEAE